MRISSLMGFWVRRGFGQLITTGQSSWYLQQLDDDRRFIQCFGRNTASGHLERLGLGIPSRVVGRRAGGSTAITVPSCQSRTSNADAAFAVAISIVAILP